jgi:hypothetical protein
MRLRDPLDLTVRRIDESELHLRDCAHLAELFFASDVSSRGPDSYDARAEQGNPERIERADIDVLNSTFRAMIIRLSEWEDLYTDEQPPWLAALDQEWDLVTTAPEIWQQASIEDKIETAVRAIIGRRAWRKRRSCCT